MDEKKLKELLMKENEEFKHAFEQHKILDSELKRLLRKNFLTDEEKVLIRELKKKKLITKDRLYSILTEFKESLTLSK